MTSEKKMTNPFDRVPTKVDLTAPIHQIHGDGDFTYMDYVMSCRQSEPYYKAHREFLGVQADYDDRHPHHIGAHILGKPDTIKICRGSFELKFEGFDDDVLEELDFVGQMLAAGEGSEMSFLPESTQADLMGVAIEMARGSIFHKLRQDLPDSIAGTAVGNQMYNVSQGLDELEGWELDRSPSDLSSNFLMASNPHSEVIEFSPHGQVIEDACKAEELVATDELEQFASRYRKALALPTESDEVESLCDNVAAVPFKRDLQTLAEHIELYRFAAEVEVEDRYSALGEYVHARLRAIEHRIYTGNIALAMQYEVLAEEIIQCIRYDDYDSLWACIDRAENVDNLKVMGE